LVDWSNGLASCDLNRTLGSFNLVTSLEFDEQLKIGLFRDALQLIERHLHEQLFLLISASQTF
jgi:hypothetical protein